MHRIVYKKQLSESVKLFDVEVPLIAKKFKAGHEKEERTTSIIKHPNGEYLSEEILQLPSFQPNSAFDVWGVSANES